MIEENCSQKTCARWYFVYSVVLTSHNIYIYIYIYVCVCVCVCVCVYNFKRNGNFTRKEKIVPFI